MEPLTGHPGSVYGDDGADGAGRGDRRPASWRLHGTNSRRRGFLAAAPLLLGACGARAPRPADDGARACPAKPTLRSAVRAPLPDGALDVAPDPAPRLRLPPARAEALDDMLQRAAERTGAPAIDAAVRVPAAGQWQGRLGWADRPAGRRVDAHTEFWWASCGKTLTASLVLRAEQSGLLGLEDPLERWFADLSVPPATRVLDLLRHTSTLLSYNHPGLRFDPLARYAPPEALLARVVASSREGCPGLAFSYSNTNYLLLAMLLQQVWKQPFHVLVQTRLAQPLGLGLRALEPGERPGTLAFAHAADGSVRPWPGLSTLLGAGDVVGSASDWVHAWEALLQGRLAGPAAPRWTPLLDMALPDPDSRSWYGLGVMAMDWRDARGRARLWLAHTGGARDGGNAVVLWDPLVGAFAAVAVNGTGSAVAIANALLTALEDSAGSTP